MGKSRTLGVEVCDLFGDVHAADHVGDALLDGQRVIAPGLFGVLASGVEAGVVQRGHVRAGAGGRREQEQQEQRQGRHPLPVVSSSSFTALCRRCELAAAAALSSHSARDRSSIL